MQKECKVVMLPTQSKAVRLGQLVIGAGNNLFSSRQSNDIGSLTAYELYITSDEEIKEGEYGLDIRDNKIFKCERVLSNHYEQGVLQFQKSYCKKIIATTDRSITIDGYDSSDEDSIVKCYLPQPSKEFIEAYIKTYNKSNLITKIEVEYEDLTEQLQESVDNLRDNCLEDFDNEEESPYYHLLEQAIIKLGNYSSKIKLNSDNTINIKQIKDSWNRSEVVELCTKAVIYGFEHSNEDNNGSYDDRDNNETLLDIFVENFIKENL